MARDLPTDIDLNHSKVRTCLTIVLADSSVIRVASGAVVVDGHSFLALLATMSPLQMGLTIQPDKMSGQITNVSLALGQALIADDGALENNYTELGICFEDLETGAKYYDEKISGEITKSQIDDEFFSFRFESDLDAAQFNGKTIASEFPDVVVVAPSTPTASDDFSDLQNTGNIFGSNDLARKLAPLIEDPDYGRFVIPEAIYITKSDY